MSVMTTEKLLYQSLDTHQNSQDLSLGTGGKTV